MVTVSVRTGLEDGGALEGVCWVRSRCSALRQAPGHRPARDSERRNGGEQKEWSEAYGPQQLSQTHEGCHLSPTEGDRYTQWQVLWRYGPVC